jgi:hypothetical protein
MIIYTKKNIHKWSSWRNKSKFLFCLTSGFLYSSFSFIALLLTKWIFDWTRGGIVESSAAIAIGAFPMVTFLSIALWYENERRYQEWLKKNQTQ